MPSADELLDLLGSSLNRRILELTSEDELDADAIADGCESSLPTVYRHIDDLRSAGLLSDELALDADGNHYKTYRATLGTVTLKLVDGEVRIDVARPDASEASRTAPDVESVD